MYQATAVVHTEEGAALAPGEKTGKNFDPESEHNAALIEAGLLRASDRSEASSKAKSEAKPEETKAKPEKASE